MDNTSVLLVEGQGDVDFFEALLRKMQLLEKIDIRPPKSYGETTNTVSHFPRLMNLILKRIQQDEIQHFGIIADADYTGGGGFQNRWNQITSPLKEYGYRIPEKPPKLAYSGSIFRHPDGLSPVGLWLMPDHKHNGMLEDLIESAINEKEKDLLLKKAKNCLEELPVKLFSDYHRTKARIYTWLAWQKRPGQTLDVTVNGNLINLESLEMKGFISWLHNVFL
jgi:hypothetical protein